MKKLLLFGIAYLCTLQIFAQGCTVTASTPLDTIVCGQAIYLTAFGQAQGTPFLVENFDSGGFTPGSGWSATTQAMFNNPCSPNGVDGTPHVWLGNSSPVPRALTTSNFNLNSCANAGVTICFDMLFSIQGNNAPCEGPDLPGEGVYIQYSTNNGSTWTTIHYFDPNGGNDPLLTNWNNWCFPVPVAALTNSTRFRWFQDLDSGADFDHWGLDNIAIYCNDSSYNIVWQHDGYNAGVVGGTNPTPVTPRGDTSYIVTMSNGTTTCADTVKITVRNPQVIVDAGPDTTVCEGTCAQINATGKVLVSPAKTPTYVNNEFTPITSFFGSVTEIPINVTGLNMTDILPNSITSVCITNIQFFGVGIGGQVDVGDLVVTLTCPSGQTITLIPANITTGTNSAGYANTCFVPVGGGNISTGTPPYSGNWAPQDSLNSLAGCDANGIWKMSLRMNSILGGGFGTFFGWSITFDDPEISNPGIFSWAPTTNMTGSTTLSPLVCPTSNGSTNYVLTLRDTAGCVTMVDSVSIGSQFCCNVGITASTVQPACDSANGSINLTVTPAGLYTYLWDDSSTAQNRTGLRAGLYHVTVTDTVNGCIKDTTIALNSSSNLSVTFPTVNQPTCALNDGSVLVTLAGGTAPYSVTIDTGGTPITITIPFAGSQPIPGLRAGTITVSVYDADSCFTSNSVTLNVPNNCCTFTTSAAVTQPGCAQSTGSIALTVTNGSGNYTYVWSNNLGNGSSVSNLGPGTYSVTITDNTFANCNKDTLFTLSSTNTLSVNISNPTNPACGLSNGSVSLTITGGTAPYTAFIDTGSAAVITLTINNAGTQTIQGLPAVGVVVRVTDAGGCADTSNVLNLVAPANCCNFTISAVITRPGCGATNGSVTVTPSGGSGRFGFVWGGGLGTSNSIANLSPGSYTLTIVDSAYANCSKDTTFIVNSNSNLNVAIVNPIKPSCGGGQNGQVTITVSAGTAPYSVAIDTDGVTQTITLQSAGPIAVAALDTGTITVRVTDAVGCEANATYTFNYEPALSVQLNYTGMICYGTNTGSASATVNGGTPNFNYQWSVDSTTSSVSGLSWGYIAVTVTDANNCTGSTSNFINQTDRFNFQATVDNPICQAPSVEIIPGYRPSSVLIPAPGVISVTGFTPDTITMIGADTSLVLTNLAGGIYYITVTDTMGCSVSDSFPVLSRGGGHTFEILSDSATCNGGNDGRVVVVDVSGFHKPYTYQLSGGAAQNDSIFENLAPGLYDIVITDSFGCPVTYPVAIGQPGPLTANASPDTISTAPGVDNAIVVTTDASNPIYQWSPVEGLSCNNCANPIANVDSNRVFVVLVSDSLNPTCFAIDSVVIIINGEVKMPNAFTPNGDGHNDFFGPVMSSVSSIKEFRIYNRWGAMVFNSNQPWDGRFNNKEQQPGTYIYYIVTESPDPQKPGTTKTLAQQGSFTLLR